MSNDMPSRDEILAELKGFIIETFAPGDDPDRLAEDYPLMSTGIVDSAGLVMLLTHLEDLYGVTFTVEEIAREEMETMASIAESVQRKLAGGRSVAP